MVDLAIKSLGRNFGGLIFDDKRYTTGFDMIIEKLSEYNKEVKNIIKEKILINNIKDKIMDNFNRVNRWLFK